MKLHTLNLHRRRHVIGVILVTVVLALTTLVQPVSAQAQETQDNWTWRASMYAWLTNVKANSGFPTSGGGSDIEIDIDQILSGLDFTFMGALKARKGSWGMFTDILYLDVGGTEKGSRDFTIGPGDLPAGIDAKLNLDIKSTLWSIAGTYNLRSSSRHETDILLGARMVDMKQTLRFTINGNIDELPLPERSGSSKISNTSWDAIIGVSGHTFVGEGNRWFIPYLLDVGTGDSDLTWQAMTGVGYKFGWGALELTYRYLDYEFASDSPVTDLNLAGPLFGATFQW